jgi:hypothetical protein
VGMTGVPTYGTAVMTRAAAAATAATAVDGEGENRGEEAPPLDRRGAGRPVTSPFNGFNGPLTGLMGELIETDPCPSLCLCLPGVHARDRRDRRDSLVLI